MKLYSLSIIYKGATKANLLKAAYDLSSYGYFHRSSYQEFMTFTSALLVERTSQGSRASVKEQEYLCHVYVRNDNLGAVVIADAEYPQRVCFTLLDKVLEEFSRQVDSIDWPSGNPETINYKALDIHLSKYQNPREADAMTKVQAELDETKIILHNTMESLLERGEKLDDLVAKSEHLGTQSKAFYKTARKQNSCCEIMWWCCLVHADTPFSAFSTFYPIMHQLHSLHSVLQHSATGHCRCQKWLFGRTQGSLSVLWLDMNVCDGDLFKEHIILTSQYIYIVFQYQLKALMYNFIY